MIRTNLSSLVLKPAEPIRPRSLVAALLAVTILLGGGNWFYQQRKLDRLRAKDALELARENALNRELALARTQAEQLALKITRRGAVLAAVERRVNWAPLLERIFAAVPAGMEFASVQGFCVGMMDFTLEIKGRIAAKQPRLECDKFRLLIGSIFEESGISPHTRFKNLEDVEESLTLDEVTYPIVEFSIELIWQTPFHGKQGA